MTEQPSVPSGPQQPATFEATTHQNSTSQPAAPHLAAPDTAAPQFGAAQFGAPQYGAPQSGAPQYGYEAPQYGAPQLTDPAFEATGQVPGQTAWQTADQLPGQFPGAPIPGTPKKRGRGALIGAVGLGYAVLAVGTAVAVVVVASPAPVDIAALSGPTASAGASAAATTAAPATTPPTTAAPTPTSTVTGAVNDGIHTGDLRFFLLPAPQGPSSVQGDSDGTKEAKSDVVTEYGGGYTEQNLTQLNFQAGATRTYQDSTLGANVTIELLQFGSHSDAKEWLGLLSKPSGVTSVSIPGESGAIGWSQTSTGSYMLSGLYVEGDTFYDISIYATQEIDNGSLTNLMTSQYSRLANG